MMVGAVTESETAFLDSLEQPVVPGLRLRKASSYERLASGTKPVPAPEGAVVVSGECGGATHVWRAGRPR